MKFLLFLILVVLFCKLFISLSEGFDGNCFRSVTPNFSNSEVNYINIKRKYEENSNASIQDFLKSAEEKDFNTNKINNTIVELFKDIGDNKYVKKDSCKLSYIN